MSLLVLARYSQHLGLYVLLVVSSGSCCYTVLATLVAGFFSAAGLERISPGSDAKHRQFLYFAENFIKSEVSVFSVLEASISLSLSWHTVLFLSVSVSAMNRQFSRIVAFFYMQTRGQY